MARRKEADVQPIEELKTNPSDNFAAEDANKKRKPGNWITATSKEIAQYEKDGLLVGHDRETGEVLLKGE